MSRRLVLLAVLWALGAPSASGQETTASVTGTVMDQTGAVLPGVTVTARNTRTGWSKQVTTTETGRYTVPFLPVGDYEIGFTLAGFRPHAARGVTLHVNDRLTVDVALSVAGRETTVEVAEAAPGAVQPTSSTQSLMGPLQVQELPLNNRNFVQLATLVPGVSSSLPDEVGIGLASTVSLSIAGARRSAVNWFVDGASNVDAGSNITLLSTPTLESIEEFRVITSSYAAEWPRSGGGVVNVVTRGGTNAFRATAYEYYRDDSLNANGFFRKQSDDTAVRDRPPALDYHNFGYTLAGPLKKDRLFFFWSQEWRDIERAPTDRAASVPDPLWLTDPASPQYVPPAERDPNAVALLAAWPAPNTGASQFRASQANPQRTRQEVLRLDWNIGTGWRLMARYTHDLSRTTEAGGLFFGTAIPDVARTTHRGAGPALRGPADHRPRQPDPQRAVPPGVRQRHRVRVRGGGSEPSRRVRPGDPGAVPREPRRAHPHRRDRRAVVGRGRPALREPLPELHRRRQPLPPVGRPHPQGGTARRLRGEGRARHERHPGQLQLRRRWRPDRVPELPHRQRGLRSAGRAAPTPSPSRRSSRSCGTGATSSSCRTPGGPARGSPSTWACGTPSTPGVTDRNDVLTNFVPARFDPAAAPAWSGPDAATLVAGSGDFANGIIVAARSSPYGRRVHATDWGAVQPRLGVSWDPGNDSRTMVRAGFGVFHDQPLVGVFLQNAATNPPFVTSPTVLNPLLSSPGAGTSRTAVPPAALVATGDDFALPRMLQWSAGVERRLFPRAVLDVSYLGSRGSRLLQPVDVNAALPPGRGRARRRA